MALTKLRTNKIIDYLQLFKTIYIQFLSYELDKKINKQQSGLINKNMYFDNLLIYVLYSRFMLILPCMQTYTFLSTLRYYILSSLKKSAIFNLLTDNCRILFVFGNKRFLCS